MLEAPYPVRLYAELLAAGARNQAFELTSFLTKADKSTGKVQVYTRHDIDTRNCVNQVSLLIDVNCQHGLQAGVYFRVDDEEYRLADHRDTVDACLEAGMAVGLHTVCYVEDDYLGEFARESDKFEREAGFRPKSFTVHGLGEFRKDVRHRFYEEISQRMDEFGFSFTDCHRRYRSYDYVIEDCHWDAQRQSRFMLNDFTTPPGAREGLTNLLILTHPCYWTDEAPR